MRYVKWTLIALLTLIVVAFFHYTLPSRDVVRIVGTEVKRQDVGRAPWFWASTDAGTATGDTRDVRFINAVWPNGNVRVYRNEDTNWGWPPYLKFDSGNLTAQAQELAGRDETTWVAVSHYGWRIKLLSIFPNTYRIREVSGPDVFLVPWFNIVFLGLLALGGWLIFRRLRRLKEKHIDPVTDRIEDAADTVGAEFKERQSAWRSLWKRWFG